MIWKLLIDHFHAISLYIPSWKLFCSFMQNKLLIYFVNYWSGNFKGRSLHFCFPFLSSVFGLVRIAFRMEPSCRRAWLCKLMPRRGLPLHRLELFMQFLGCQLPTVSNHLCVDSIWPHLFIITKSYWNGIWTIIFEE